MSTYNGWTNYATWRVNLEIFDGFDPHVWWEGSFDDAYDLGKALKHHVEDVLEHETGNAEGLAFSYAMAFLADVNWTEIAQHIINDIEEETAA